MIETNKRWKEPEYISDWNVHEQAQIIDFGMNVERNRLVLPINRTLYEIYDPLITSEGFVTRFLFSLSLRLNLVLHTS